ncbi:MAG TPA: methionine sulfoxide reductase [Synergistaceae bacterium]|nr:methionine sulfoxide reductase [Synergistaceae bacterium]
MWFDPSIISYRRLLDVFWSNHDPFSRSFSRQYRTVLFYHDETQHNLAKETLRKLENGNDRKVETSIEPAGLFYPAEAYHQKYFLQNDRGILEEIRTFYPDFQELLASTSAARVNGFLGGYGTEEEVQRVLPLLGLSEAAQDKILKRVVRFW